MATIFICGFGIARKYSDVPATRGSRTNFDVNRSTAAKPCSFTGPETDGPGIPQMRREGRKIDQPRGFARIWGPNSHGTAGTLFGLTGLNIYGAPNRDVVAATEARIHLAISTGAGGCIPNFRRNFTGRTSNGVPRACKEGPRVPG